MDEAHRQTGAGELDGAASGAPDNAASAPLQTGPDGPTDTGADSAPPTPPFDETLVEELGALIDNGRNYAQAEISFQKTRAMLMAKLVSQWLGLVIVALIMVHIASLALAVGLVIALAPLVTIWGAIAIVLGLLLLTAFLFGRKAYKRAQHLADVFLSEEERGEK